MIFEPFYGVDSNQWQAGAINGYRFTPQMPSPPTRAIIYYHGWSSEIDRNVFRCQVLASRGFLVLLPELMLHGARGHLNYDDPAVVQAHFWEIIDQSVRECDFFTQYLERHFGIDKNHTAVVGHSMGGFVAACLLGRDAEIGCAVAYNASLDWVTFGMYAASQSGMTEAEGAAEIARIRSAYEPGIFNPIEHLDRYQDRPLLLTNGSADSVVPTVGNDLFVSKARAVYSEPDRLQHIVYDNLVHVMTDHMLDDGLAFMTKHL